MSRDNNTGSSGGQGDALHEAVGRIFGCDGSPWRTRDVAAVLRDYAALAARQPVGEPVSEKLMRLLRERAALPESVELSYQRDGDGTGRAWWDRRHAELEAQGYTLDFETDSGAEWHTLRGIGDELRAALAEYDAAPAQETAKAVDLERFRGTVKSQYSMTEWMHRCGFVSAEKLEESKKNHDHLMALIDSHSNSGSIKE